MRSAHTSEQKPENKGLVFAGLGVSAAAFILAVVPLILFFVPGAVGGGANPFVQTGIYTNAAAVATSFAGVVMTAAAKPRSGIARLSLFFGATAFLVGLACFILCLVFGAIIPLHSIV